MSKKYWIDAIFSNMKTSEIIEGYCGSDGQLLKVKQKEVAKLLSYYDEDKKGWFWNSSHDRYIAEKHRGEYITANPCLMWYNNYEIIT